MTQNITIDAQSDIEKIVGDFNNKLDPFLIIKPTVNDVLEMYNQVKKITHLNYNQKIIVSYYLVARRSNPLPLKEIAYHINIPINQIKSKLNRVLKQLNITITTQNRIPLLKQIVEKQLDTTYKSKINEAELKQMKENIQKIFDNKDAQLSMCNLETPTIVAIVLYKLLKGKVLQHDIAAIFNIDPVSMRHKKLNETIDSILSSS